MTEQSFFEASDIDEAKEWPALGPAYFAAKRKAAAVVEHIEAEDFEPMLKKAAEAFYEKLLDDAQTYLLSNAEDNVGSHIRRGVDESVQALLGGNQWAIDRYVLGDRHDAKAIRAALAALIPAELQNARLVDAEAEIADLKVQLQRERHARF